MAVIAPTGVVGRIVTPTAHAAKVQLLIDRNAAAGAVVERSRAQGIVLGGDEELLRMNFVSSTADVKVGDRIVTSGVDGIYPKGFVIGKVETVDRRQRDLQSHSGPPVCRLQPARGRAGREVSAV